MNVFLDTNIVLDVFTLREPFYDDSAAVWGMAERREIVGLVSAVTMTSMYYIVRKERSRREALEMLKTTRSCVEFAPCDTSVLDQSIDSEFKDFEDAVQYFSARAAGAEVIITRNQSHFAASEIPVMTPAKFLATHRPRR